MSSGNSFQALPIATDGSGDITLSGEISVGQSTVATPANSATITTAGVGSARVNPSGNVTGIVLQAGTRGGQQITVLNESAFTLTMAASGTSNVADGTSDVIPATSGVTYVWDSTTALWYASGGSGGGGFADPTTTKGDIIVHGSSTTRLGVGTDTFVLTADSAQTLGVKWASNAASGSSTSDHYIVGYNGQNDTDLNNKIIIPGLSSHPDIRAGGGNDDEFDQNAAGTPSGWSTFGVNSIAADTNTYLSHLHLTANTAGSNDSWCGIYKAAPPIPYTVTAKVADFNGVGGLTCTGLFVMDNTTTSKFLTAMTFYNSSHLNNQWEYYTNWTTNSSGGTDYDTSLMNFYFRIVVHAGNNCDVLFSRNGKAWITATTGFASLSNATYVGLALNPNGGTIAAYWDWIRFT